MDVGSTISAEFWLEIAAFAGALLGLLIVVLSLRTRRVLQEQAREIEAQKALIADAMIGARTAADQIARASAEAIGFVPQTDEVPEALVEACALGTGILFTGAAIGPLAGLPTWGMLLEKLTEKWSGEFSEDRLRGIGTLLERGDEDAVAELLESRLGRVGLMLEIGLELSGARPPDELVDLVQRIPFSAFLTTNFDDLLEKATADLAPLMLTPRSSHDFSALLRGTRPFILKLHGDPVEPESTTATLPDLRATIDEVPSLRATLRAFFETRSVFFIGHTPETVERLCEAVGSWRSTQRHFALVPDSPDLEIKAERMQARYQVELLRYSHLLALRRFLGDLTQRVEGRIGRRSAEERSASTSLAPAKITRLVLRNIGPFDEAEFDFHKPWTVILGNNGSGKSTVLRALALGLSGRDVDARRAARSLLRRGELSGTIEVTVDSGATETTYETQLAVEAERIVVKASTAPLQAGTLAAFGFPAIRGVPPAEGFDPTAEESYTYPRVADVLPLIRGGLDDRSTNLRRWIFISYVRSQDETLPAAARLRYRSAIDAFFKLVDAMTPGFAVRFSRCDTETYEILLDTSDGEIPLDYISQGMSSTIGWAGILIQRLSEIYPERSDPENGPALLLIDEVDSHLHPEWQMNFVPTLKALLPNVQVIATTHSPLMVGNLGEHEVIRVSRQEGGLTVEHLAQSFTGYRADQILTDAPFEMESTRAKSWEAFRDEYAVLTGRSERTPEEDARFAWLTETLRQAPPPFESREERLQAEELEAALRTAIEAVAGDETFLRKLKAEAQPNPSDRA